MTTSLKKYLLVCLKGIGMGAADVIPGVSGGTIAFMTGIYEELVGSINNINGAAVKLLFKGGNPDGKKRDNFIIENSIKEKETGSIDTGLPVTMYTNMSGNSNMMFVTFPETKDGYDSQWTTGYFSNEAGEETNRRLYDVSQNKADGKAVRFISVIYPYGSAAEYENIKVTSAEFVSKDFSETGATVRVVITKDGTPVTYNLTYTL